MNYFMYSKCGEGAGLLKRIQEEGNSVALSILDKDYTSVYDGILTKRGYPEINDIVIFDSSSLGARADKLRGMGFKTFGASKFHDKLECDRGFGLKFMQDHGIMIPETKSFMEFSEGIKFLKENSKKRYVFKPSGKDLPTKLTYSCSDQEDLLLYMKYVEDNFADRIDEFVLQEFIEGKIISSEYWVGKDGFIEPINHTIEVKKLMNDDLGPSTGCSGNIVWQGEEDSVLADELRKVEKALVENEYIGPIDINCLINEKGIYALEWTPRFGLDAMPSLLGLIDGEIGKLISDLAQGLSPKMKLKEGMISGGIRLTIPPYPVEPKHLGPVMRDCPNEGIPIRGLEESDCDVYFYEVKLEDGKLVHSAGTGVIACISDLGNDPEESLEYPLDLLDECKVPDKQYRTDLGDVLPKMYEEVTEVLDNVYA